MEFGSYHAIVARVAAGTGIAIVPRSIIRISFGAGEVVAHRLPPRGVKARTCLVWRVGHQSTPLAALRSRLRKPANSRETAPAIR